jgi:hypothetical protein
MTQIRWFEMTQIRWPFSFIFAIISSFFVTGLYDTVFQCRGGEIFVLRVDLTEEPLVQLFGCHAEHPLIDAHMYVRIAYHDRKLLGAAVMETIAEMQLNPPRILFFTDSEVEAMQPPAPPIDEAEVLCPGTPVSVIAVEVGSATISALTSDPAIEPRLSFSDRAQTVLGYTWADEVVPYPKGGASLVTYDEYWAVSTPIFTRDAGDTQRAFHDCLVSSGEDMVYTLLHLEYIYFHVYVSSDSF